MPVTEIIITITAAITTNGLIVGSATRICVGPSLPPIIAMLVSCDLSIIYNASHEKNSQKKNNR